MDSNSNQTLPPIKAREPGRGGRKHTLATARLNPAGKVELYLLCVKPGCGCSGWFALEELLEGYEGILHLMGEEKERAA